MDRIFSALSDNTRREIIKKLSLSKNKGIAVSELAAPFLHEISLPAVSKHIKVLTLAGLLRQERIGKTKLCYLEHQKLEEAESWLHDLSKYWSDQLDSLSDYFENKEK